MLPEEVTGHWSPWATARILVFPTIIRLTSMRHIKMIPCSLCLARRWRISQKSYGNGWKRNQFATPHGIFSASRIIFGAGISYRAAEISISIQLRSAYSRRLRYQKRYGSQWKPYIRFCCYWHFPAFPCFMWHTEVCSRLKPSPPCRCFRCWSVFTLQGCIWFLRLGRDIPFHYVQCCISPLAGHYPPWSAISGIAVGRKFRKNSYFLFQLWGLKMLPRSKRVMAGRPWTRLFFDGRQGYYCCVRWISAKQHESNPISISGPTHKQI